MGDSHAALYGAGCGREGMAKATYGTGSSVMLFTGLLFLPLSVFFMLMVGIRVKRKQGRASRKR